MSSDEGPLYVRVGFVLDQGSLQSVIERAKSDFSEGMGETIRQTSARSVSDTALDDHTRPARRVIEDDRTSMDILREANETRRMVDDINTKMSTMEVLQQARGTEEQIQDVAGESAFRDIMSDAVRGEFWTYLTKYLRNVSGFATGATGRPAKRSPLERFDPETGEWAEEQFRFSAQLAVGREATEEFLSGLGIPGSMIMEEEQAPTAVFGGISSEGYFIDLIYEGVREGQEESVRVMTSDIERMIRDEMGSSTERLVEVFNTIHNAIANEFTREEKIMPELIAEAREMMQGRGEFDIGTATISHDPQVRGRDIPGVTQFRVSELARRALARLAESRDGDIEELGIPSLGDFPSLADVVRRQRAIYAWLDRERKWIKRENLKITRPEDYGRPEIQKLQTVPWGPTDVVGRRLTSYQQHMAEGVEPEEGSAERLRQIHRWRFGGFPSKGASKFPQTHPFGDLMFQMDYISTEFMPDPERMKEATMDGIIRRLVMGEIPLAGEKSFEVIEQELAARDYDYTRQFTQPLAERFGPEIEEPEGPEVEVERPEPTAAGGQEIFAMLKEIRDGVRVYIMGEHPQGPVREPETREEVSEKLDTIVKLLQGQTQLREFSETPLFARVTEPKTDGDKILKEIEDESGGIE